MRDKQGLQGLKERFQILNKYSSNFHKKFIGIDKLEHGNKETPLVSIDKSKLTKTLLAYHSVGKFADRREKKICAANDFF